MVGESFEKVLGAAREGQDWAWAVLFRSLAPQVTGYLASRGAAEPEDVTGEVFLQVARGIHSFAGDESSFRAWVFTIAHRRLIDQRRARARRASDQLPLPEDRACGDVEAEAMENLVTEEILAFFAHLTDDQRSVLTLRIIGDLSVTETARVLGKSVGAVKATQRRALFAIRSHLETRRVTK